MKIRKGDTSVKLPPIGQLCSVMLDTGNDEQIGMLYPVIIVTSEDFEKLDKTLSGTITHASIVIGKKSRLRFFPIPDAAYTLRIRYYPPMQEV